MDLKKVEKLIELLQKHNLSQIEFGDKTEKIVLVAALPQPVVAAHHYPAAQPVAPAAQAPPAPHHAGHVIKSPFVGTFYASASPTSEPFVTVGKRVKKGSTLCVVEAMKLMNEIEADKEGVIKEILIRNGDPVQYDQPLFILADS